MATLLALLAVIGGLILLTVGADRLIVGACAAARRLRLSEAVIGATIVAGGTSLPELVASLAGALGGQYGLAVGNVVGSNSFNIGAILGLVALVAPVAVARDVARRDWTVMIVVTILLCLGGLFFGVLPWWLCAAFLALWVAYIVWAARTGRGLDEMEEMPTAPLSTPLLLLWIVLGIGLLASGGWLLLWGAVGLARSAGVSDAIIGLTIVAAGTSAPELVTSLLAARRGKHQLAVANLIGSNTFNILLILGVTGLIGALPMVDEIRHRDLWWMLGFALVLPALWWRGQRLGRLAGGLLLGAFLVYLGILIRAALADG